jgi:hypothetical protein
VLGGGIRVSIEEDFPYLPKDGLVTTVEMSKVHMKEGYSGEVVFTPYLGETLVVMRKDEGNE